MVIVAKSSVVNSVVVKDDYCEVMSLVVDHHNCTDKGEGDSRSQHCPTFIKNVSTYIALQRRPGSTTHYVSQKPSFQHQQ